LTFGPGRRASVGAVRIYRISQLATGRPVGPPIPCSLDGAADGERVACRREVPGGAPAEPLPGGGRRVRRPADRAPALAAPAVAERECCPFPGFRMACAGAEVEPVVHVAGLLVPAC
jgi:hypothetical protein